MAGTSDESNIGELQSDKPSTPGPDKPSSSSGPIHSSTPEIQMNNSTQGSQNSSGTPSFTFRPPWVDAIFVKLSNLEARIAKIDKIDSIDTRLGAMEVSINSLCTRMTNIEKTTGSLGNTTGELKRHISTLTERLQKSEDELNKLADRLQDLQCRSMRDKPLILWFG